MEWLSDVRSTKSPKSKLKRARFTKAELSRRADRYFECYSFKYLNHMHVSSVSTRWHIVSRHEYAEEVFLPDALWWTW